MCWTFQVHFENTRVLSPVLKFLFNHPLETMGRDVFTHCPTVKIICVQVGDIFRRKIWLVFFSHIRIVRLAMLLCLGIVETPPRISLSNMSNMSGPFDNSNSIPSTLTQHPKQELETCSTKQDPTHNFLDKHF